MTTLRLNVLNFSITILHIYIKLNLFLWGGGSSCHLNINLYKTSSLALGVKWNQSLNVTFTARSECREIICKSALTPTSTWETGTMPEEGKQMIKVKSKVLREGKTTEEKNPQTLNKSLWSDSATMQELHEKLYRQLVEGFPPWSKTSGQVTEERVTNGGNGGFHPQF